MRSDFPISHSRLRFQFKSVKKIDIPASNMLAVKFGVLILWCIIQAFELETSAPLQRSHRSMLMSKKDDPPRLKVVKLLRNKRAKTPLTGREEVISNLSHLITPYPFDQAMKIPLHDQAVYIFLRKLVKEMVIRRLQTSAISMMSENWSSAVSYSIAFSMDMFFFLVVSMCSSSHPRLDFVMSLILAVMYLDGTIFHSTLELAVGSPRTIMDLFTFLALDTIIALLLNRYACQCILSQRSV